PSHPTSYLPPHHSSHPNPELNSPYLFHYQHSRNRHLLPSFPTRRSSDLRPGGFLQFSILHPCFVPPHRRVLREPDGTTRRCGGTDRKSTRLNSSHVASSYAVFCLKKKSGMTQHSFSASVIAARRTASWGS